MLQWFKDRVRKRAPLVDVAEERAQHLSSAVRIIMMEQELFGLVQHILIPTPLSDEDGI